MRLKISINTGFALLLISCLVLFGVLAFHELVLEPHAYAFAEEGGYSPKWVAIAELAIYSCIPVILLAGFFFIRRTLQPLNEIARQINAWDPELGLNPLVKTYSPETAAVTSALAGASERLRHAFREIREFSLRASHEIKTPLTILRGQAETEARRAEMRGDIQCAARMETQIEEIDRLARLVDSLGLLSKADAGLLVLDKTAERLDDLVTEYLDDIRVLAEPSGIVVSTKIDRPVFAFYDRRQMRQIFLSLVENAVKYNIPGGVIEMGVDRFEKQAVLWIENTGVSLDPAEVAHVFDPFFRGSRTSRDIEGTGLGLSIARSILEAHGGSLSFQLLPNNRIRVALFLQLALASSVDTAVLPILDRRHIERGLGSGI